MSRTFGILLMTVLIAGCSMLSRQFHDGGMIAGTWQATPRPGDEIVMTFDADHTMTMQITRQSLKYTLSGNYRVNYRTDPNEIDLYNLVSPQLIIPSEMHGIVTFPSAVRMQFIARFGEETSIRQPNPFKISEMGTAAGLTADLTRE